MVLVEQIEQKMNSRMVTMEQELVGVVQELVGVEQEELVQVLVLWC